jgi:hypothetical protein
LRCRHSRLERRDLFLELRHRVDFDERSRQSAQIVGLGGGDRSRAGALEQKPQRAFIAEAASVTLGILLMATNRSFGSTRDKTIAAADILPFFASVMTFLRISGDSASSNRFNGDMRRL